MKAVKDAIKAPSKPSALGASLAGSGAKVAAAPPLASTPAGVPASPPVPYEKPASRRDTVPITVHVGDRVRRQLKSMAADEGRSMEAMVHEALNLLFARYHRPEIASRDGTQ